MDEIKSSENDQLTGHFQSFVFVDWSFSELFCFFRPHDSTSVFPVNVENTEGRFSRIVEV